MEKQQAFLENVKNWDNHRPLLWLSLEATKTSEKPVLEMGCGEGSTPYLKEYCEKNNRTLISYDFNKEWADKYNAIHVEDWDAIQHYYYSVILIDHSPGERRYIDIENLKDKAKIIVIHDSEPEATGYMLDKVWHLFKYRCDVKTDGAWATAVSNSFDVTQWKNESIAGFLIS
jgi:hypothetical protein